MAEVTLFKNYNGNVAIVTPSLKKVDFVQGKFFTKDAKLEAELLKLAEAGDYGIYVDKEDSSVESEAVDPMEALRAKIRKELEAEMNQTQLINAGNSTQTQEQFVASVGTTADSSITGGTDKPTEQAEQVKQASTTAGLAAALAAQVKKS